LQAEKQYSKFSLITVCESSCDIEADSKIEASRETTQRAIVDILGSNHKL
jgi:hypothetical protein